MMLTLKYRLFPDKGQERMLQETLETCRTVYNSFLNWRKHDYEVQGKGPNYHAQAVALAAWKKEHPELSDVHSRVLQNVAVRVDLAYKAFFRRVKSGETPGFPRFKGDGYDSFTYPQSGFKVGTSTVSLSLFGRPRQVKAKVHRPVPGDMKTCTVRRQSGKWFACVTCEVKPTPLPPSDESIGIDLGLKTFAALSDGTFIENPRFFRKDEKSLAKAQRRLAKQPRGSKSRRQARKIVSRVHERIRNRRHDFVHQNARRIVNRFSVIAVERLNIKGMVKNHCLAKSISDASWSMFRAVLTQKAESAARQLIAVNPAYTSQRCSGCGYTAPKTLKERWRLCPMCGLSLDRDTNAAVNIVAESNIAAVGQHSISGAPL